VPTAILAGDGTDKVSIAWSVLRGDAREWLKGKGITDVKAIHSLRKESGSLIAASFGIEAARQHLGHRDISTTSAHYVGKKMRFEVKLDAEEAKLRAVE